MQGHTTPGVICGVLGRTPDMCQANCRPTPRWVCTHRSTRHLESPRLAAIKGALLSVAHSNPLLSVVQSRGFYGDAELPGVI